MQATLGKRALVRIAQGLAEGEARGQRKARENTELRVSELVRDLVGSLCDPAFKRGFADSCPALKSCANAVASVLAP
jgi:hypothetical protein